MKEFDPAKVIYTPPEVALFGNEQIGYIKDNKDRALDFFIPGVKDYFAPLLPYESVLVNGQTSNYKSGFIYSWEYAAARQFQAEKRNEVIVHVSVEDPVEEAAYLMLGIESGMDSGELARGQVQDWNQLERAAIRVGTIPVYRIGHSLKRKEVIYNLHVSNMLKALWHLKAILEDKGQRMGAIFFDYLQAFPVDDDIKTVSYEKQKRLQVASDFLRIHRAAPFLECPIIVAVQARENLRSQVGLPQKWEIHESTDPIRHASRSIQISMPKDTFPVGHHLEYGPYNFDVADNHLFVKIGKQRGRLPSGRTWLCWIDFDKNEIAPVITQELNPDSSTPPTNSNIIQGQTVSYTT